MPYATLGPKTLALLVAELTDDTRLEGSRQLSYYFPGGPKRHCLDIIVRHPTPILCRIYGRISPGFKIKIDYREYELHALKRLVDKKVRDYGDEYDPQELQLYEVGITKKNILLASPHQSALSQVSIPLTKLSGDLAEIELKDPVSHKLTSWPKPRHLHLIVKFPAGRYVSSKLYAYCSNPPRPKLTMSNTPESLSHVTSQMIKRKFSFPMKPCAHKSKSEFERLPADILGNPAPYRMKLHHYIKNQTNRPIIDGCHAVANPSAAVGPPVQLFHPAFGHFLDDIADETLSVPEPFLAKTFQFMQEACRTGDKSWDLNNALSQCLESCMNCCQLGGIWHDGAVDPGTPTILMERATAFCNELDPAIQVSFSFSMAHAQVRSDGHPYPGLVQLTV